MKPNSEGSEVKKTEQFVLDAYTYTEAETRMVEILEAEGIRPFEITNITKTNLAAVIRFAECDKWFKVKVAHTSVDESKSVEKESNEFILVSAKDVKDAYEKVITHMNSVQVGYLIPSVVYQKIAEVFPIEEWTPVSST
jgi:type I site-specific restriction-modification system R (restriction) subunit